MHASGAHLVLSLCALAAAAQAQQTVYAAFLIHREGDRSPLASSAVPALAPAQLSALGYDQVVQSGVYYRSRYVSNSSAAHIAGLDTQLADLQQLAVQAQSSAVLQNSATAFLQGLYPPVGLVNETLASGVTVVAPNNGYQLVPVSTTGASGASDENTWLQDAEACANFRVDQRLYQSSSGYQSLVASTKEFYGRLWPVVNQTVSSSFMSYQNAYSIFDLINVARIHNRTIPSAGLLDSSTVQQLQQLANQHEFGAAYSSSADQAAIGVAGMQLGGQVLTFLSAAIAANGGGSSPKFGMQFSSYPSFLGLFGLTSLSAANANFTGIPDYASSMTFELVGPASSSANTLPSPSDLSVRFLFSNGSTGITGDPQQYPLFGGSGSSSSMSWNDFQTKMNPISITSTSQWCSVCGNWDGYCSTSSGPPAGSTGKRQMSNVVAGVVGALVTLAVVLGLQSAIALLAGLRLVRKRTLEAEHGLSLGGVDDIPVLSKGAGSDVDEKSVCSKS